MRYLVALAAGFGGLLLEMLFVRRHGLLIGNTAAASATVLALFLTGLGVGGLWLPRRPWARHRPLGSAAVLYAGVAVTALLGDLLLQVLPPVGTGVGVALAVLVPGVPALLMGGAFPLLFAGLPRHAAGWWGAALVAANLAGSVAATFVGGNFAIPLLGLRTCGWIGAGSYGLAALGLCLVCLRERRPTATELQDPPPLARAGAAEWAAALAGFLVLGLEVFMLRRLPFFLDGFQPTLSGVLAACLLGLTLGAVVGPPLFRRLFGAEAAAGSIWVAVILAALGLHEWAAPVVGRLGVTSDLGFHLRIVGAAAVAAGLPCLCLGATVPLCLERFIHPETRAPLAGRLFFYQGVGSLAGALAVGHGLPHLLPEWLFRYGLSAVLVVALLGLWRLRPWMAASGLGLVVVLAAVGVTSGQCFRPSTSPVSGSRYDRPDRYRYLDHRSDEVVTASVVYDRSKAGLILFTDEFRAAYIDADSGYMKVLGHLPFLLRSKDELARVAVVALGTGTTANAVHLWPDPKELHVVEISSAVVSLVDHFAKDGPAMAPVQAPFRTDPRTQVHVTDGRRFVARRPAGSLDLISMEPLLPYAPGTVPLYTKEFYTHCGRALSERGLMVQWVPTHSMPEHYFRTLVGTFAGSFAHHSVWLLNHSTLLIGSKQPHLPPLDQVQRRMGEMPEAVRRDLHGAGLARGEDLVAAFVGADAQRVCDVPDLHDDRPFLEQLGYWSASTRLGFLPGNLAVLRVLADRPGAWPAPEEWRGLRVDRLQGLHDLAMGAARAATTHHALAVLALGRTRDRLPESVLLYDELLRARQALLEKEVLPALGDPTDLARRVEAKRIVRHLEGNPGSALLWAVRAKLEPREVDRHEAMRTALALDPTFYLRWPSLRPDGVAEAEFDASRGPFEDLAVLPGPDDLCRRVSLPGPESVAYRVRFRVQVGYALLALLGQRPFTAAEAAALRAVLDPALLQSSLETVRSRGGDLVDEVLPLWRSDLALPPGLEALRRGSVVQRQALAGALGGRRGFAEVAELARLLEDPELSVRKLAGVSLFRTFGDRIRFDPEAPEAERKAAVEALRQLYR